MAARVSDGVHITELSDGLGQTEPLYKVPLAMYKENREKLLDALRGAGITEGVVLHKGQSDLPLYDTDSGRSAFRQESYFSWMFGVLEPDVLGTIDIATGQTTLFVPKYPDSYAVWMGPLYAPDHFTKRYAVDATHYVPDVLQMFNEWKPSCVYVLKGLNTDSDATTEPATFEGLENFTVDSEKLHPIAAECRVIKSSMEMDLLRYVNRVTSRAHVGVMQTIKPGQSEHQCESLFRHSCFSNGGCRHMSYCCITVAGSECAILHYPFSDKVVVDGTMCLFDMGGEYMCYGSDVTCSFPANGRFTDKQRFVYETVWAATEAVLKAMGPGVSWLDMHLLANRVTLQRLLDYGLVQGELEAMMAAHLGAVFQPHGLGHFLGMEVHDVGGHPPGTVRPTEPGLSGLRTIRKLMPGMFITVEPGLYFNPATLGKAYANPDQAKFLVREKIEEFSEFGGVRIEEDVFVTEDGCEVVTCVPRTVADVEAVMAHEKNASDFSPRFYKNTA